MTSKRRCLLFVLCAALPMFAAGPDALACACCTSTGTRTDVVMKLNSGYVAELERLRFDRTAQLFLAESEPETVRGITTPAEKYDLQASWQNDRMVFAFRDQADRSGTLALAPKTMRIFHVDPRNQPDSGRGPVLYKEWRLASNAAGAGIFAAGIGLNQSLTLVLQGRGNNCTSASDFTHWMLVMWGPKAKYHFFGSLLTTP
jgi:hypothetical protein